MLEIRGETLERGAVIAGRYRLERVLGEGGMGVVWSAQELAGQRTVALKFLREGRETDPKNQERFLREARAAMAIAHPNVAKVHAVLETDAGVPFLVMELLEGESLRALLDRRGALTAAACARLLLPVVDAVAAAHVTGVVHRDLKPENVFLVDETDVRVLDFGIAKLLTKSGETGTATASLTSTGALLGTPLYMAPEQIFGDDDIDGRADIWSMGIILYECLAAKRPTDGDGFGPIIKRITTEPLVPLEEARPGLPGRVTRLVGKMLSRRRDDRPSLDEIRAVLESVALAGDEALPSERKPAPPSPPGSPLEASTTAGVASRRSATDPARVAANASRAPRALVLAIGGVLAVTAAGAFVSTRFRGTPSPPDAAPLTGSTAARAAATSMPLLFEASAALQRRDGAACLRALDTFDAQAPRPAQSTKDPSFSYALTRATCMMLAGDCEGGKSLYARAYAVAAASSNPSPDAVQSAVDSTAAQSCEGNALGPRDEVFRANYRLQAVSAGLRKASAAECREWSATEKRLAPVVKPRGPGDVYVTTLAQGIEDRASACLARAGECADSYRIYRDDWTRKNPLQTGGDAQAHEQSFRTMWTFRSDPTPCRGKP